MPRAKTPYQICLAALREHGMLMPYAPPPDLLCKLQANGDVICTRLCAGERTFVHRSLWPDVLAMALSEGEWQTMWLPPTEKRLLALIDEEGTVTLDLELAERVDAAKKGLGQILESRLLALGTDVATGSGEVLHTLTSWWAWAAKKSVAPNPDEDAARTRLEAAARACLEKPLLPWWKKPLRYRYPR